MAGQQSIIVGITAVLCLFGTAILIYGALQVRRAATLARRCTHRAGATVVRMVDHASGRRRPRGRRDEGRVLAANEAIAAKKRTYQKKRAARARREADEALATWSVVVNWAPAPGAGGAQATDGAGRSATAASEPLTLEGRRKHRRSRFKEGQALHVCYDPCDPSCAYIEEEGLPRTFGLTMMGCGAALVVLGVVCWFALPALAQGYAA